MSDVRFKLNGEELPFPSLSSLSFKDAIVINHVTGLDLASFHTAPVETRIAGQIGVAMARAHADWSVQKVVEAVLWTDMSQFAFSGVEEPDTGPLPESESETSDATETPASTDNATESGERSA